MRASQTKLICMSLACAVTACSRGAAPNLTPSMDAPAPAQTDAQSMVGQWSLVRTPRGRTPFFLDLKIDSTSNGKAFGRVTRYFAGDVGGDPSAWRGFAGDLTDSTLTIAVRDRGQGDVVFYLEGTTAPDTVSLREFRVSGANLSTTSASWRLVRSQDGS